MSSFFHRYRCCFLGDPGCGKTEAFSRFIKQTPPRPTAQADSATIATDYGEAVLAIGGSKIKDAKIKLMAWDTPGSSLVDNVPVSHCSRMDIILFHYDISDRVSFLHLQQWLQEVAKYSPGAIYVLIGAKKDLINRGSLSRAVETEEAQEFADEHSMRFAELNVTNDDEVNEFLRPVVEEKHDPGRNGRILWDSTKKPAMPSTRSRPRGGSDEVDMEVVPGRRGGCFPCICGRDTAS